MSKKKKDKQKKKIKSWSMLVPIATLVRLIGAKEWGDLLEFIRKKFPKVHTITTGYEAGGVSLYSHNRGRQGDRLGLLKDLMVEAGVQSNPKEQPTVIATTTKFNHRILETSKPVKPRKSRGEAIESEILSSGL